MKAFKKKYGKRPWIDTPNAAWYRKRCDQAMFLRGVMSRQVSAATYANIQQVRATPAREGFDKAQKAVAIENLMAARSSALKKIFKDYPMPDPNSA